jgi:hypothetical protein
MHADARFRAIAAVVFMAATSNKRGLIVHNLASAAALMFS